MEIYPPAAAACSLPAASGRGMMEGSRERERGREGEGGRVRAGGMKGDIGMREGGSEGTQI